MHFYCIKLCLLDPVFVVSGPKDHARAAIIASISTAKYVRIYPIFQSFVVTCQ